MEYFKNKDIKSDNVIQEALEQKKQEDEKNKVTISVAKLQQDTKNFRSLIATSMISLIVWSLLFFNTRIRFSMEHKAFWFVYVLPIGLIILHAFFQIHALLGSKDHDTELQIIKDELKNLEAFSNILPTLLFGLGTIFIANNKIMHILLPLLVMAALFGTIIPNLLTYITFDHNNLDRLFLISNLDFISTSFSFSYLFACILQFLLIYKK